MKNERKSQEAYDIHPIVIDTMLQSVGIASACGSVKNLSVKVPFSIGEMKLAVNQTSLSQKGYIKAVSEVVSFGTISFEAELCSQNGNILIQMQDGRAVANQQRLNHVITNEERNPMLRITWKPEFSTFTFGRNGTLSDYLQKFIAAQWAITLQDQHTFQLAGTLDLLTHSDPNLRILKLGGSFDESSITKELKKALEGDTKFKRFLSYTRGIMRDGELHLLEVHATSSKEVKEVEMTLLFNVILFPKVSQTFKNCIALANIFQVEESVAFLNEQLPELRAHLAPNAN